MFSAHCCPRLKLDSEELSALYRSKQIDKMLENDRRQLRRMVKLLLLGAGESGKSTFLKQMNIIHGKQFDLEALHEYRFVIYHNIVKGMKVLVDARQKLGIPWGNEDNVEYAAHIMSYHSGVVLDENCFMDFASSVRELWKDSGIQTAFSRRYEFQIADSVGYFLDNLDRISERDYLPSNQDVLFARRATRGISETFIMINNIPFLFVDVGGQRRERQKWFTCFEEVTSIMFFVASSEYDQVLLEDRRTNRLREAISIFDTILNNRFFRRTSVILFLNKTDLLANKLRIQLSDIRTHFEEFKGDPWSLRDVQTFILNLLISRRQAHTGPVFHHFTTAVDTENIKVVFTAVKDSILQRNLESLMLN
ncbi:unnamed protein product [Cyprideis torosa]|uniref:Uncharacterized protein n=1 Tax=Cyprideis torosa TaxID=163714 RepID=A0A7R8WI85_9CRUS|nr:unnamed protein product [Cyprideis torosa]CAG0894416.1 unnamed protein product [Cyprideis torosa]